MIYRDDVAFFLECFSTSLAEIESIWHAQGGFVGAIALAQAIVAQKHLSARAHDALTKLTLECFPVDRRSRALERHNFIYGLADHYAESGREDAALVEFDVGNCSGAGAAIGDDMLLQIIRYMRQTFETQLTSAGATFVQAFDVGKNDDLHLIVTGLSGTQMAEALSAAQDTILRKLICASDIPHSKYASGERDGIGVGSGFVRLGCGRSVQELREHLNLFVEKRKLEDIEKRRGIRGQVKTIALSNEAILGCLAFAFESETHPQPERGPGFPFDLDCARELLDPFEAREFACAHLATELGMRAAERATLMKISSFYHSTETLTGARRDTFLTGDMRWVLNHHRDRRVTVVNFKAENCAGLNKVLSQAHSAATTRHVVETVSAFVERHFGGEAARLIYYVGCNSFHCLLPGVDVRTAQRTFERLLQPAIDAAINRDLVGPYFARFDLEVPVALQNVAMGTIENLRGLEPGVLVVNIDAVDARDLSTEVELMAFRTRCLSRCNTVIGGDAALRLPDHLTYEELEEGRTLVELLELLQAMAHELIEKDRGGEPR